MRVLYNNLWVSEIYKMASFSIRKKICNGCGPKGIWSIVPDTFYGLRVTAACNPHDFDYFEGQTLKDKKRADKWLLVNLNRIIKNSKWKWLRRLRQRRAKTYYYAVKNFGVDYFTNK